MRGLLFLALFGACSFDSGALPQPEPPDAAIDVPVDTIVPTWALDETSGKAVPATATEWMDLNAAYDLSIGAPAHIWLMQEASGSLADSIGNAPLNPLASPSYQGTVAGWSRRAVGTPELTGDRGFGTSAAGDWRTGPTLLLGYVAVTASPATERSLVGVGAGADHRFVSITPQGFLRANGLGAVQPVVGIQPFGTTVHPVVIRIDSPNYVVYTDEERLHPVWANTANQGPLVFWGAATLGAASARYLYGALWTGPSAALDDAGVKTLLRSLGWTVSGY